MLLGIGPEHAGGGSAPGVRCKRIADSLPVVEGPDADIEVSHWRPQAGRTAAASDVALSTGSTKTEDTSSGAGRRQTVLGSRSPPQSVGPSTHLADVTQRAVNLDTLKFDNQELHKCWLERQVVPDGGSFLFANENQPHIEQDSRLSRLAAYLPEDTLPPKTAPKAFGWSAAERSREDVVQPESHPSSTTPVAEETSEATTVTSSLGAARFMQMRREVPQPKACQVPQTSLGAAAMRGRSAKARAKQRPSKSPGSLVRDASSRQQLVSPRPLSVRGLGDRRTGPVVADHKLGEDALRHSQDLRRETSAQKVSPLSSSLKERVEALTMTETERAFSAMNVNRRRTEMTNANKQKAGDASKETQLQASQATEDILREVGRIESPRQPAPIQSILEPVQPEIEPARRTNEPLADSASDTMQENVDLITDSIVATVEARACTGHEDDDVEPIGATVRAGPSREPLGNRPLLGEVFKSSTDNASLRTTSLRDDIANLTEQMRGIVRAIGSASNDGSKTATATSADSNPVAAVSPPMLTASMAQAVHNELERLIGAQDVSEDSNTKSSDAPPTLNTTATEISSSTREAVERLSSNPLEATSNAASQFDKMNRGPVPVPKRGSRQQLIRSPYAEPPTRSPARQQRAPRDISDERRKRLGTLGLARSENKANALAHSTIGTLNIGTLNISTIGTLNQGHRREPNDGSLGNRHGRETADGSLPFESVDTEEIIDSVVSNEVVANFGNAEESKKRPSTSWYSPAAARELVSEKKQAAEIRKREEEEKEKKRLEGMRRLESAYKARVGCGAGKPNPSKPVAKAAASQPAVPEQRGKPPPSNTSTASATEGSKPQSRGTSLSSFRPAPRKTKGTAARATTKRRPSSAGATSRRRWNEALEDMTKRESQNPRMTPQLGQQLRRGQSLLEETGSAALASLSDGGDISEGSRRFQEPRLATKIRIATRLRARNKLNLLRESQSQFPASLPEAWAESHEPSTDSHALSLQGDRRDLNVDLGFPYPWANEPTWQRGDRITDDLGWAALDPTQWPPTRHAQLGLTDPANRTPSSSDVSEPPSPRTDFQGDARSQRPSSYLTPDHRRIVDEVVAEQRWWRRVRNDRPPASPYAHHEVQGKRPPSRGGESCQPLGPTTPPSYENDLPETYTQYQPLIRSLERPASPYADVTDDDDESLTPSFVGNQDLAAERQESGANPFGGFHHRPTSALPVDPGYGLPDDIGGTAVADTIVIEDTEQLDIPSRPVSGYTEERRLLGQRQRLDLHWTSTQPSPADCRSPCGASNDSSSNDFALPSVSFESEEAEVVEGGGVFEVDEWQFAERPTVLYEDFARTPSARSSTQQVEETADEDVIAAAVDGISAAIEETMVKTFMCDEVAGEKAVAEKIAREKAAIEKAAAEHAAAEREVAAAEKAAAEKAAAAESAAAERAAEAAAEKAAAEKAAREKAAADKVKAAAEQAARDKVTLGGDESPSAEIMSELDETLAASEVLTSSPGKAARCVCGAIFLEESIYCMRCGTKRPRKDPPSSSVKKLVEDYEQTIRQEISHAKRLAKTSEEASLAESSNPEVVEVGAESQPEGHRASDTATTERTTDTAKSEENKATVVEQVLTSVMDDLLDDSLQVAQSARSEPALRYPTPNATFNVAAITEMFTEDSKSESDSADSERKTPPGSRRTLPEKLAEDPEAVAKKAALKAKSEAAKAMELASTAVTAEQAEAASEAARNAAEFAQQAHAAAQKAHALVEAARSRGFQQAGEEEAAAATTPTATTPTKTTMPVKPNLSGEDSPSDAKSTSSSSDSSLGRELQAINAKTDTRVPFGSLSGGDIAAPQKIASSPKEPPRPPSPPPSDMRSAATTAGGDAAGEYRGFRSRDEVADLVTGDLIQMLLTEAFELHPVDNSSPRKNRRGHSDELRGSKTIAIGDRSPPKRPVSLTAKDAEDKTNRQGYPGIDTSESLVAPFFASVMKALGVTDEESPVQMPVADLSSWLPSIIEVMRARESAAKTTDSELEVGEGVPRAAEASLAEDPLSPSAASRRASRDHDMESWTRLLADALVEIAGEEVKAEPRVLGWRRPGYGEPPLSRFRAQQAAEGKAARPQQTWKNVKAKLEEATRFAIKSDTLGDSTSGNITAGGLDDLQSLGAIGNIDEKIDQLIEEGIAADEASWLDIGNDVVQVKNQVVQMIFSDLLEETAAEIQKLWPPDNG